MIYYWSVRNNISQVTSKYLSLNLQNLFLFNSKHQVTSYLLLSQSNRIQRTSRNRATWTKRRRSSDIVHGFLTWNEVELGRSKQLESFVLESPIWSLKLSNWKHETGKFPLKLISCSHRRFAFIFTNFVQSFPTKLNFPTFQMWNLPTFRFFQLNFSTTYKPMSVPRYETCSPSSRFLRRRGTNFDPLWHLRSLGGHSRSSDQYLSHILNRIDLW